MKTERKQKHLNENGTHNEVFMVFSEKVVYGFQRNEKADDSGVTLDSGYGYAKMSVYVGFSGYYSCGIKRYKLRYNADLVKRRLVHKTVTANFVALFAKPFHDSLSYTVFHKAVFLINTVINATALNVNKLFP